MCHKFIINLSSVFVIVLNHKKRNQYFKLLQISQKMFYWWYMILLYIFPWIFWQLLWQISQKGSLCTFLEKSYLHYLRVKGSLFWHRNKNNCNCCFEHSNSSKTYFQTNSILALQQWLIFIFAKALEKLALDDYLQ